MCSSLCIYFMFIVWRFMAYDNEENYLTIWIMETERQGFTVSGGICGIYWSKHLLIFQCVMMLIVLTRILIIVIAIIIMVMMIMIIVVVPLIITENQWYGHSCWSDAEKIIVGVGKNFYWKMLLVSLGNLLLLDVNEGTSFNAINCCVNFQ